MEKLLSDKELIEQIKQHMAQLRSEFDQKMKRYQTALSALSDDKPQLQAKIDFSDLVIVQNTAALKPETFRGRAQTALKEANFPMTSRELASALNLISEKEFKNFSSHFSIIYKKAGIQKIEFGEGSDRKSFYAFTSWFDGDNLKQEYKQKIYERHRIAAMV